MASFLTGFCSPDLDLTSYPFLPSLAKLGESNGKPSSVSVSWWVLGNGDILRMRRRVAVALQVLLSMPKGHKGGAQRQEAYCLGANSARSKPLQAPVLSYILVLLCLLLPRGAVHPLVAQCHLDVHKLQT